MKKSLSGFSLIEVLISLLILAFILLGFDAMQIYSLRENRKAYFFSVAENQLHSMAERLRAYGSQINIGQQIIIWNKKNKEVLPDGKGHISGTYPIYELNLSWKEGGNKQNQNYLQKKIKLPIL